METSASFIKQLCVQTLQPLKTAIILLTLKKGITEVWERIPRFISIGQKSSKSRKPFP